MSEEGASYSSQWSGDSRTGRSGRSKKVYTCDDCFFRANNLCALALDEPCATFRPNRPEGLVPPRQPALLLRDPAAAHLPADEGLARTA